MYYEGAAKLTHTVLTVLVLAFLSGGIVYAQDGTTPNPPQNFCVRITTTLDDTYYERLAKQKSNITQRQGEIAARVATRRAEVDASIIKYRADAAARRADRYAKLNEHAQGDAAKLAAVTTFKTSIESAVSTRYTSVDAARSAFRAGQDLAHSQRSNELMTAFNAYEGLMKSAISQAQADCSAGVTSPTVRTAFTDAVKNYQNTLSTERKAAGERLAQKMTQLIATRKSAFDQAVATFRQVAEAARVQLRAAFGVSDLLSADLNNGVAPLTVLFNANLGNADLTKEGQVTLDFGDGSSGVLCRTLSSGVLECPTPWTGPHTYQNSGGYIARLYLEKTAGGKQLLGTESISVSN